jgi:hypothetical protein
MDRLLRHTYSMLVIYTLTNLRAFLKEHLVDIIQAKLAKLENSPIKTNFN